MRRTLNVAALGLGLVGVASSPALAMGPEALIAHIPFAFHVRSESFPAGDYRISPLSDLQRNVVEIRSTDGRHAGFVLTEETAPAKRDSQPKLVFDRYGKQVFMHAIRVPEDSGAIVTPSRSEIQAARALASREAAKTAHRKAASLSPSK